MPPGVVGTLDRGHARFETGEMDSPDEDKEMADIIERLSKQFPAVPQAEVATLTHEAHHVMDGRPIRNYVPVLVEREVKERLKRRIAA